MSIEEDSSIPAPKDSQLLFYQLEDGRTRVEVRLDGETVWLTQRAMAELFQKDVRTISEHIKNILDENEQQPEATIRKFRIVQSEGNREVSRNVDFYNLEMIISVGYRVRSTRGTQFRRWATERLREYIVKGFTMDDERLKEGKTLGVDYFDELLERIRDIRASEKRFYQKIRELFTLAIDYDPKSLSTQEFFQIVQNKLHWAVTRMTAPELIASRSDASKPNMGLTSWKGAKVRKGDVTVAKNYLNEKELGELNRIVSMYLDFAEDQTKRRQPLYIKDWLEKIDAFLKFSEREILDNPGHVSMEVAHALALDRYEQYQRHRLTEEASNALIEDAELERTQKLLEAGKAKKPRGKK